MSRKLRAYPISMGKSTSIGYAKAASSSGSYNSKTRNPFGPGMAEDIFSAYDEDYLGSEDCVEEYHSPIEDLDPQDLFNGELQSFHFRHQESLDLETNEEREARLKHSIRQFDRAYRAMALFALKWHYLQEDLEEHEDLKKMFRDIQMLRKLKGSDFV